MGRVRIRSRTELENITKMYFPESFQDKLPLELNILILELSGLVRLGSSSLAFMFFH